MFRLLICIILGITFAMGSLALLLSGDLVSGTQCAVLAWMFKLLATVVPNNQGE